MKSNHLSDQAKIEDYVSMAKHYLDLAAKTSETSNIPFNIRIGNKTISHKPGPQAKVLTLAVAAQLLRSSASLDTHMRNKIAAVLGGASNITYYDTDVNRYAPPQSGWQFS